MTSGDRVKGSACSLYVGFNGTIISSNREGAWVKWDDLTGAGFVGWREIEPAPMLSELFTLEEINAYSD